MTLKTINMKVRITDLPLEGLNIQEPLNIESLNARLQDDQKSPFSVLEAPIANIRILPLGQDGAQVSGFITASYKQECSLCLEPADRNVKLPVEFQIRIKPTDADSSQDFEDDVGMVFIEDETAILDETLEEIFILSLDLFWHPSFNKDKDSKERCAICKKTREQIGIADAAPKSTLADLLAQPNVKSKFSNN
jgi:uncharacterized metal-binding protein YceD (DUF177 family)